MKKIIALTLAIIMCFCTVCFSASADIITIGLYQDWEFYGRSAPEYVALQYDADGVSFSADCTTTPDEPEILTCFIIGVTDSTYSHSFIFEADGTVTSYFYGFPEGLYKVYFVGNPDVEKSFACTLFTKID